MAENKQPTNLNGAYYGPAIPPRPAERRRSCCCCLFSVIWKLLLVLIILAVIAVLVFWVIVQPRIFKFYVNHAEITQFDYNTNTTQLRYNMVLNFTAHNPNKKLGIYYDQVLAKAFYQDTQFASANVITFMNSFRQDKKGTNPMSGVFSGQQLIFLDYSQYSQVTHDKNRRSFDIYVKLYFQIRFRLGDLISGTYKPRVKCDLNVPFTNATKAFTFFKTTKCDIHF
ncbi:NDR1/HIN1-like protein 3 [Arachis duranensis]|uniref:NDR1/HIN1-like protein 3 n=1 Tax=Arachis duranensis TaxID=130453 RepID=A0A6P4BZ43_ARADU|nr:NDR1/HIN1-like protein 3 [Arachis duranensis]